MSIDDSQMFMLLSPEALSVEVAKAAGWRVVPNPNEKAIWPLCLYAPGKSGADYSAHWSEESAWEVVSRYSKDYSFIMELIEKEGAYFNFSLLEHFPDGRNCFMVSFVKSYVVEEKPYSFIRSIHIENQRDLVKALFALYLSFKRDFKG